MSEVKLVREWDTDTFQRKVAELEAQGYEARSDTYRITPQVDPGHWKLRPFAQHRNAQARLG